MSEDRNIPGSLDSDQLYERAIAEYGNALLRLGRAYESDPLKCQDLLQEIHFALWRSFETFEARCSLRTWVYRVAHNIAISYVVGQRRMKNQMFVSLEEVDTMAHGFDQAGGSDQSIDAERLLRLVHQLKPIDRQLMLLYLEDLDSPEIGEITGFSAGHVRTQIHRIKAMLARRFHRRTP